MLKILSTLMTIGLVVVAFTLNQGCGSSTTQTPISTLHSATYVGSGSVWSWALNVDGTFTATKKATAATVSPNEDMIVTGTYVTNATGFYTFTVGTATSPNGSETSLPTAGTTAAGFGVPGVVLMVKPAGADDLLIMPVLATTCPTGTIAFNWVHATPGHYDGGSDLSQKDLWGNASLPAAAGDITGAKWRVNGTVDTGQTLTTHTGCTNGQYTMADGFINMTDGGVGLVNTNGNSDILALPRETSVSFDTLRGKSFVALVFSKNGSSSEIFPLNITFPSTGTEGTYSKLSDVTTGEVTETGTITMTEAGAGEQAGFIKLTANTGNANIPTMWAATVPDIGSSGRTFFFASGTNMPAAVDPFAVIAIQK